MRLRSTMNHLQWRRNGGGAQHVISSSCARAARGARQKPCTGSWNIFSRKQGMKVYGQTN